MKGSCLCGAVKYDIEPPVKMFQYCHCSRCQKVTGSAHAANMFVAQEQLTWLSGEENVQRFEPDFTKYFATCFCKTCGSALPWVSKNGAIVIVPAGGLDEDPQALPSQNIFWGSKACWYQEPDKLPKHDELPIKK